MANKQAYFYIMITLNEAISKLENKLGEWHTVREDYDIKEAISFINDFKIYINKEFSTTKE
jgi:hypothetical protein